MSGLSRCESARSVPLDWHYYEATDRTRVVAAEIGQCFVGLTPTEHPGSSQAGVLGVTVAPCRSTGAVTGLGLPWDSCPAFHSTRFTPSDAPRPSRETQGDAQECQASPSVYAPRKQRLLFVSPVAEHQEAAPLMLRAATARALTKHWIVEAPHAKGQTEEMPLSTPFPSARHAERRTETNGAALVSPPPRGGAVLCLARCMGAFRWPPRSTRAVTGKGPATVGSGNDAVRPIGSRNSRRAIVCSAWAQ